MEMAEFVDLPGEVICMIASFSDITSVNSLRLVCLSNQHLYINVFPDLTTDVKKRAILRITNEKLRQLDLSKDLKYLLDSEIEIGITLSVYGFENDYEILYDLLNNFVKKHHDKVTQLGYLSTEDVQYDPYEEDFEDFMNQMLPHFKNLRKFTASGNERISADILTTFKNNVGLKTLELHYITNNGMSFKQEDLPNVKDVTLTNCLGNFAKSLLSATVNLKQLHVSFNGDLILSGTDNLEKLTVEDTTNITCLQPMSSLRELSISDVGSEDISLAINQIGPTLTKLRLKGVGWENKITASFPNLRELSIDACRGDIYSIIKLVGPGLTNLELCEVNVKPRNTKCFPNLRELVLLDCSGEMCSILNQVGPNLTNLVLAGVELKNKIVSNFPNLRELEMDECRGEICSTINLVAPSLIRLGLFTQKFENKITTSFLNLRELTIDDCSGETYSTLNQADPCLTKLRLNHASFPKLREISIQRCNSLASLQTEATPTLTLLELEGFDKNTEIYICMKSLKNVIIDGKKIDISKCSEFVTGKLKDLFN